MNVKSKPDINTVPELKDAIAQVEKELGEEGRVLIRYSGPRTCAGSWWKDPRTP